MVIHIDRKKIRYDNLTTNEKIVSNDIDNEINKLLASGRHKVLLLLNSKYGVTL